MSRCAALKERKRALGTRRFQRAVSARDLLIGISLPKPEARSTEVWFL